MTTTKVSFKIDLIASARKLAASGQSSVSLFQHGDANLLLFVPIDQDTQGKHERDEIYVIQSGQGIFKRGSETVRFDGGDVLFVPAGVEHRFASFSEDFKAWVLFFGPKGGTVR
jgi:mannose-6-phosphate isomerase-like protein (cupin superfamily)